MFSLPQRFEASEVKYWFKRSGSCVIFFGCGWDTIDHVPGCFRLSGVRFFFMKSGFVSAQQLFVRIKSGFLKKFCSLAIIIV